MFDFLFNALFDAYVNELTILRSDEYRLEIKHGPNITVLNKKSKKITRAGKILADFADVKFVDIRRTDGDDEKLMRVSLMVSWRKRIVLGYSRDEADASIVAARAAGFLDRTVRL